MHLRYTKLLYLAKYFNFRRFNYLIYRIITQAMIMTTEMIINILIMCMTSAPQYTITISMSDFINILTHTSFNHLFCVQNAYFCTRDAVYARILLYQWCCICSHALHVCSYGLHVCSHALHVCSYALHVCNTRMLYSYAIFVFVWVINDVIDFHVSMNVYNSWACMSTSQTNCLFF